MTDLLVGVDPHRRTNTAQMMDDRGRLLGQAFQFANNRPGAEAFIQAVVAQVQAGDYETLRIATEATGWYWFHFFQKLSQDPLLNRCPLD